MFNSGLGGAIGVWYFQMYLFILSNFFINLIIFLFILYLVIYLFIYIYLFIVIYLFIFVYFISLYIYIYFYFYFFFFIAEVIHICCAFARITKPCQPWNLAQRGKGNSCTLLLPARPKYLLSQYRGRGTWDPTKLVPPDKIFRQASKQPTKKGCHLNIWPNSTQILLEFKRIFSEMHTAQKPRKNVLIRLENSAFLHTTDWAWLGSIDFVFDMQLSSPLHGTMLHVT